MDVEGEATSARGKRKRRWIIVAASGSSLVLVAAGAALLFRPARPSTNSGDQTTANFADVNAVDANQNAASAELSATVNATDINATGVNEIADGPGRPSVWEYFNSFDQVQGQAVYYARIDSQNSTNFDFPYQGGSKLSMTVRFHPKYGNEVILKISKGQFVCGVEDCSGTINYGSGPRTISLSEPTDNSSDTLFVSESGDVIDELKKSKTVIVELPFYQEGNRQFSFEVRAPLAWPPKGAVANALATGDDE